MSPNGMKIMESVVTCKFGVSVLFLLSTLTNTAVCQYPCITIENECGCVFKNAKNEPMLISLWDLNYKNGTAYFLDHDGLGGFYHYYLNLCTETTAKNVGCMDVTGCQVSTSNPTKFYPIAKSGPLSFGNYTPGQVLTVTYKQYRGRQMFVHLTYKADVIKKVTKIVDTTANVYHVYVETKFLVPHPFSGKPSSGGLSTGSIMVIVFFVIVTIYLVAGILFMKYQREATGKELIPNVEFWSSLPELVKDGCVFFAGKMKEMCQRCSQRDGYNEI